MAERAAPSEARHTPTPADAGTALEGEWVCPNCQFTASGRFCASCGQSLKEWIISTPVWLRHGLNELLDVDGRIFRTLRLLIRHPGQLTQAWIDGRRMSYITPLRLYLFSSAVLFGLLALPGVSAVGHEAVLGAMHGYIDGRQLRNGSGDPLPAWLIEASQDEAAATRIAANITDNLPRAMFLLLPFGALLLKLLVRRPHKHYVVHLVWTLHVHAVIFLLTAVLTFLNPLRGAAKYAIAYPVGAAGLIWASWYVVTAFSTVHRRSFIRSTASLARVGFGYVPAVVLVVVLLARAAA